jgi:hypothetical protein
MYSGFISSKRVVHGLGVHQRFNRAAFRMVKPYIAEGTFPPLKQIQHFEGFNGPDGLKVKSPGQAEPLQLYDPFDDIGEVPRHVLSHYNGLVSTLAKHDLVRSAFESSWLAHFVTDGMTPAHHYPLHDKLAEIKGEVHQPKSLMAKGLHFDESFMKTMQKNWAIWGAKGELSTHFNFEMGVATALFGARLKVAVDPIKLAEARKLGPVEFFKQEARGIAELGLYESFYETGWNGDMVSLVKKQLAPRTAQAIGILWLLAYLEAGQQAVIALPEVTT